MKKIEITHAEVVAFYGTNTVLEEVKVEKGTIVNFNIKTRINDRVSNSPVIYDKCSYFASSEEQLGKIKKVITLGNIVDIKGTHDRTKGKKLDKDGKVKYFDSIRVREIVSIQDSPARSSSPAVEDELPF
jgi:hypothetical protein